MSLHVNGLNVVILEKIDQQNSVHEKKNTYLVDMPKKSIYFE